MSLSPHGIYDSLMSPIGKPVHVESGPSAGSIVETVDRLRATFDAGVTRSIDWREEQLRGIGRFLHEHGDALVDAMHADLGRPPTEGWIADIGSVRGECAYARKRLRKWATDRRARLPLKLQPGSSRIIPQPLGLALIISPWNYPVNLALTPLIAAFAAGNVAIVKPSELAPETSSHLAKHLPRYLDDDAFAVFEGGTDVATELLAERFDHIFFTGSTRVGKIVMEAAAKNLTPIVLELGGKSPVIVADDANIEVAANRIAWAKCFNAGQTCIAPDYVLVSAKRRDELRAAIASAWTSFYGTSPESSPDFGRIVSRHHHQRLVGLLENQQVVHGGRHDVSTRFLSPTIVLDPAVDSPLATEEIFGPILPIFTVDDTEHAIRFVNERPKPLALYVFSETDAIIEQVLTETTSGGAAVNHLMFQFAPPELPFGGVGTSGMGRYHGKAGFDAYSNLKGVVRKPVTGENNLLYPPYGRRKRSLLKKLS